MVVAGLLIGIVGTDVNSGMSRFTFGVVELTDGIGIAVMAMGVFGLTEIVSNLAGAQMTQTILRGKITGLMPRWEDLKISFGPMLRGSSIGFIFGPLPGLGATISAFTSYMVEKKLAKDPSRFGKGAIEGVAGPESANNACAQTTFVPMLTLGIPGSASMALMLGAMMIHGIVPGPQVMTSRPDLFWGLIASMWIGNGMLLLLNLPLIGIWVKLLQVPYRLLFPIIMTMMGIGIYSLNNSGTDVLLMAFFGFVGYVLLKLGCSFPPHDSRDGAGAVDGGEPAPLAALVGRRRDGLLHAADQLRLHGRHGGPAAPLHAAGVQADNARLIVMKSRSAATGRRNGVRARCATLPSSRPCSNTAE